MDFDPMHPDRFRRIAQHVAYGVDVADVRDMLMNEGPAEQRLTEEQAYLVYVAAKLYVKGLP